jgi:hypothetical protein
VFGPGLADTLVALTDGVVCVLDSWHVSKHMHGYGRLRLGVDAAAWTEHAAGVLRQEGARRCGSYADK